MNGTEYRSILRGERRGGSAALWRALFRAVSIPYGAAVAVHRRLYDFNLKKIRRLPVPVVSVGNMTLGGTGKTPLIARMVRILREEGATPALLSRGYGTKTSEQSAGRFTCRNDEAAEMAVYFPDLPHYLSPNRFEAGKALLRDFPDTSVLLLDDGFQHRKLARCLDIVLLDALEPFGMDRLFPSGTLREPLDGLARADLILLSRADFLAPEEREKIRRRVERCAPKAVWGEICHQWTGFRRFQNGSFLFEPFSSEDERCAETVFLPFCGLGNPAGFFRMLAEKKPRQAAPIEFPDHYCYNDTDFSCLAALACDQKASLLLCTMKDLVKIRRSNLGGVPLAAAEIGIRFLSGEEEFRQKLRDIL